MDLRSRVPYTRHKHQFDIPVPASTETNLRNPEKERLRAEIIAMRERDKISTALGIHMDESATDCE